MEERRAAPWDAIVYGASAAVAAAGALWWEIPVQRAWARASWPVYAVAAVAAVVLSVGRFRSGRRWRVALACGVLVGATLVPMAMHVAGRASTGPPGHVQSETLITEAGAAALFEGRNPYGQVYGGDLAPWPIGTRSHLPYLPGMLAFGVPSAAGVPLPWGDARVWFFVVAVGALVVAARRRPAGRRRVLVLRAGQVLLVLPTGALALAGGGDDVPVMGLLLLGFVLAERRMPVAAGLAAGIAAAMKQIAWPVVPFLVLAARGRDGRPASGRAALGAGAVVAVVVAPFLAAGPGAFVEDVVLFPLGLGDAPTLAGRTSLGGLLVGRFPGAAGPIAVVLIAAVVAVSVLLLRRRPRPSAAAAAGRAGLLLAFALVVAPTGRPGYLAYVANLLTWSIVLREPSGDATGPDGAGAGAHPIQAAPATS